MYVHTMGACSSVPGWSPSRGVRICIQWVLAHLCQGGHHPEVYVCAYNGCLWNKVEIISMSEVNCSMPTSRSVRTPIIALLCACSKLKTAQSYETYMITMSPSMNL